MNRRKFGFTLIELLVVIGVVGVLIALLLPVLATARKNASKARCANNLSQIKRLLDTYVAENSGKMPFSPTNQPANWKTLLDTEKKGASEIYQCPSTDASPSYSVNQSVVSAQNSDVYLSQIDNTAKTIFVSDGIKDSVNIADGDINQEKSELYNPAVDENARIRHLSGANYLTLDGSITYWVPPASGDASINTQGLKWNK